MKVSQVRRKIQQFFCRMICSKARIPQQQHPRGRQSAGILISPDKSVYSSPKTRDSLRMSFALSDLSNVFSECKQHRNNEPPRLKAILNCASFNVGEITLFKET